MITTAFTYFGAACKGGDFLFFPTWYKYLNGVNDANGLCSPQLTKLSDVWLILAAVIEIFMRVAALAAVGFVMYGGFQYLTSQGEPDKTSAARKTIVNALVGLTISIFATVAVNFVAGSVKSS